MESTGGAGAEGSWWWGCRAQGPLSLLSLTLFVSPSLCVCLRLSLSLSLSLSLCVSLCFCVSSVSVGVSLSLSACISDSLSPPLSFSVSLSLSLLLVGWRLSSRGAPRQDSEGSRGPSSLHFCAARRVTSATQLWTPAPHQLRGLRVSSAGGRTWILCSGSYGPRVRVSPGWALAGGPEGGPRPPSTLSCRG